MEEMHKSPLLIKYTVVGKQNDITVEKPDKYYFNSEVKVSRVIILILSSLEITSPPETRRSSLHDQNYQENSSRETSYKILKQCSLKLPRSPEQGNPEELVSERRSKGHDSPTQCGSLWKRDMGDRKSE